VSSETAPGDNPQLDPLAAAATVAVVAAMLLFSTYRLVPVDVPWHLATGRWILENGFMTTNTFSWTHPDHPLYQQYPLVQVPLALLVDHIGWWSASLWFGLLWTGALVAWMRWGAPLRHASAWPLMWMVAALGLQRHAVQRPEAGTLLLLGLLLVALDHWRATGQRRGLVAAVGVQWLMVNTHQLFPLGLVAQFGVLAQLVAVRMGGDRLGLDPSDRERPVAPMAATLAASVAVLCLSPLGPWVYLVPLQTLSTVAEHGQASASGSLPTELGPVTADPIATFVAVVLGSWFLFTVVRARGRWRLDEVGIGLLGLVMTAVALRGIPFLAVMCSAASLRMVRRLPPMLPLTSIVHAAGSLVAFALAGLFGWLSLSLSPQLYGPQPGLGRAVGGWGDALCEVLHDTPPPGEPINLGWGAGNPLIGCAFPAKRPFVDPRFEAYPRDFLWQGTQASEDGELLMQLLDEWEPGFAVVELRTESTQARLVELVSRGWGVTHLDADFAVVVPPGPYLQAHRLEDWSFPAPTDDAPTVRATQLVHHAALLRDLGVGEPERWAQLARQVDHPVVAAELERFGF